MINIPKMKFPKKYTEIIKKYKKKKHLKKKLRLKMILLKILMIKRVNFTVL